MKKGKTLPEESSLRQKAEAIIEKLDSGKVNPKVAHSSQRSTDAEMQKLIHELQIHQIELEIQNDELQQAVEKAATASALYDFAPNGYFTVRPDGTITQLNHYGAKMLGKGLICLENSNLKLFVSDETKPVFADFLESCFKTTAKQTCEISLSLHGEPFSFFYLEGMITEDKNKCLVVAVDITERKRAEESLRESEKMYRLLAGNLPGTSVFLFDHDLRFILAEGFLHPEFGFTTSNMEGKTLWEVLPQERTNRWAPIYTDALEGRPTENLISEYKGHSYSVNILPVKNKQGEIIAGMVVSQDITKQIQADDALKANYSLLRIAGETAKFGGWSINTADNRLSWSDQVAAIHEMPAGYSPSLDEGINFYAPEWREKITQVFTNCSEKGIPYDEEMEIITAKGNRVWIRTTGEAFTDSKGKIVKVQGAFQDISERMRAKELIRESEERFRSLLQNVLSVSVQGYAPDGTTQYWNKASEQLYGYTEQEAIGRNLLELIIPPEMQVGVMQAIHQMAKTGNPIPSSELLLMRRDGSRVEVYSSHAIVQMQGRTPELFCFDIDISDRKRAEEEVLKSKQQYDSLVSKIPVGVYILKTKPDGSFALQYASSRMAELLGLSVEDLLSNHEAIFKAIHPEDLDSFKRMNLTGILHIVPFDWKGRVIVKGEIRWLHVSSLPQPMENGDTFWHGLIVDITERMRDEAEIKLKNEELTNLNATKDKFFSIIAHDLKSPFNSIIGFSSLLTRQLQEGDYAAIEKYSGIIHNSSQQAMDLLMNLLEWSRLQTGRMVFNPESIDIVALTNQSTELLNASAQQKSITIYSEMPVNLSVFADKAMIGTILRNLISNAIKFTETGGKIIISTEQMANELVVSVLDNGVGISSESIGKLFRIDENNSTLGTQNEKGTGLGLLLCKEFIDKHGGRIWVESEPGKGSRFFFSIPKV